MARAWYAYTNTGSDPLLASSYRLVTVSPSCLNGIAPCAIYVTYVGDRPQIGTSPISPLTRNIQSYIANGLVSFIAQPVFPEGTKKYVYMKASISV